MIELPVTFPSYTPNHLPALRIFVGHYEHHQILGAMDYEWATAVFYQQRNQKKRNEAVAIEALVPYPDHISPLVTQDFPYPYKATAMKSGQPIAPIFHLPVGTLPTEPDWSAVEEFYALAGEVMVRSGTITRGTEIAAAMMLKGISENSAPVRRIQVDINNIRTEMVELKLKMQHALMRARLGNPLEI